MRRDCENKHRGDHDETRQGFWSAEPPEKLLLPGRDVSLGIMLWFEITHGDARHDVLLKMQRGAADRLQARGWRVLSRFVLWDAELVLLQ